MKKTINLLEVKIDDLVLDKENPRFGKLYNGGKTEQELIEYLLFNEAAEEVATAISKAQKFYEDKALWVLQQGNKYIVKDGNRRCASLKALVAPEKFGLNLDKFNPDIIPVYVYDDESELNLRISEEHAGSLFRKWERIAKALEIFRLHNLNDNETVKILDSNPGDLIKLASFYETASPIGGEDFNKLLRRGKGKLGGKTIIFERLFRYKKNCGYTFKNSPDFRIKILNQKRFENFIESIVNLLNTEGDKITTDTIDKEFSAFKKLLKDYGFNIEETYTEDPETIDTCSTSDSSSTSGSSTGGSSSGSSSSVGSSTSGSSTSGSSTSGSFSVGSSSGGLSTGVSAADGSATLGNTGAISRHSRQTRPKPKRKGIKGKIIGLINECYSLDKDVNPNAKLALTRITFECVLKFVVEETYKSNGKPLKDSRNLREAYFDRKNNPRTYVEFDILKTKFTNAIKDTKIKNAFLTFDLHLPHQIIHNYLTGATPQQALTTCENLIPLIDFMLQEENNLLNSLEDTLL